MKKLFNICCLAALALLGTWACQQKQEESSKCCKQGRKAQTNCQKRCYGQEQDNCSDLRKGERNFRDPERTAKYSEPEERQQGRSG